MPLAVSVMVSDRREVAFKELAAKEIKRRELDLAGAEDELATISVDGRLLWVDLVLVLFTLYDDSRLTSEDVVLNRLLEDEGFGHN